VRALQTWPSISGLVSGPLFRAVDRAGRIGAGRLTARIVGERLKKTGERSGLDPRSYAAHSLRSGFATSAARANKSEGIPGLRGFGRDQPHMSGAPRSSRTPRSPQFYRLSSSRVWVCCGVSPFKKACQASKTGKSTNGGHFGGLGLHSLNGFKAGFGHSL
jgi:hypothetical protein